MRETLLHLRHPLTPDCPPRLVHGPADCYRPCSCCRRNVDALAAGCCCCCCCWSSVAGAGDGDVGSGSAAVAGGGHSSDDYSATYCQPPDCPDGANPDLRNRNYRCASLRSDLGEGGVQEKRINDYQIHCGNEMHQIGMPEWPLEVADMMTAQDEAGNKFGRACVQSFYEWDSVDICITLLMHFIDSKLSQGGLLSSPML